MNWNNKVTELLKVEYPFFQAPMLTVTTPEMVAAASNANCLGTLPLGCHSKQQALTAIQAVKKLTNKPFAVNLFAYEKLEDIPELAHDTLKAYHTKYNVPFFEEIPKKDPFPCYTEIIDVIIEEKIPIVNFHFGVPDKETIQKLKSHGVVIMASATCVDEAKIIEESGLDIVIAQSFEAGGNRGTFIKGAQPQIGLMSLVPQIVDAVKIPVIAAGGLAQPRSIAAAFILGAQGVQLGSAFLRSKESIATLSWKEAIKNMNDMSTVLTNVWTGRYGRCINNSFIRDVKEEEVLPLPMQVLITSKIRAHGAKENELDLQSLFAGQSAKYAQEKGTGEILEELVKGTEEILSRPFGRK